MRSIREVSVAVVGGAGFLGSHLVNHLIEDRKCKVLVIDNLSSGRREFVHKQAKFEHHDITGSEAHLRSYFKQYEVEYCFNYAAMPYVPTSFEKPVYVMDLNSLGALRVINAAQEAGCKGILQVSSAEIYGGGHHGHAEKYGSELSPKGKLDELCPVVPHSTYGASKAAIDMTIQARWREAKTPCIALRQFNAVGERETHPYIVPEIISQLSKMPGGGMPESFSKAYVRLGNNSFRDFLYAGDAVRIAVKLLEKGQWGEVYNLGSETGIKIYDLAKLIGKLMGFEDVLVEQDPARVRPWEIWHLQSDNSKLRAAISEHVRDDDFTDSFVPLEEALQRTIKYYEGNGRKWCWE